MRTVQISVGEIVEAMYAELVETCGDKELARIAAEAIGNDLLAGLATRRPAPAPRPRRP